MVRGFISLNIKPFKNYDNHILNLFLFFFTSIHFSNSYAINCIMLLATFDVNLAECESKTTTSCTGPLGGVKNLKVTDPTMTSLKVNWDPADGAVRQYKIFFVPVAGGTEGMVRFLFCP